MPSHSLTLAKSQANAWPCRLITGSLVFFNVPCPECEKEEGRLMSPVKALFSGNALWNDSTNYRRALIGNN